MRVFKDWLWVWVGVVVGAVLWTVHRFRARGDWPVLGFLLRLVLGAAIGFVIGLLYARGLPPELARDVVVYVTLIGARVGFLWGLGWLLWHLLT